MATMCTRPVDVGDMFMADNVRSEECMHIPKMVQSLLIHGFQNNHPLRVSLKEDGKYLVLAGNRRLTGVRYLQENDPEAYNKAVPGGKLPAIIHKGLTPQEEIEYRIDHSGDLDREPLDEWSLFLAIKQLDGAGYDTQESIAIKLGLRKKGGKTRGQPRREYVQTRVSLARLPQFVQDQFRMLTLSKDDTAVRWNMIPKLYKAFNEEYLAHKDGDGPLFSALWKECTTPVEVTDTDDATTAKELTPAEAIKRSQAANSEGLKAALLAVTRQSDENLAEIDTAIGEGETAVYTLLCVRAYLGEEDYTKLVDSSLRQAEEKQAEVKSEEKNEEKSEEVDAAPAVG